MIQFYFQIEPLIFLTESSLFFSSIVGIVEATTRRKPEQACQFDDASVQTESHQNAAYGCRPVRIVLAAPLPHIRKDKGIRATH